MLNGSQTARWLWVHALVKKEMWPHKPLSKCLWSLNGKGIAYISVGTRKTAEKVSVPEINYCNCRSVSWMMLYYPASKTRIVVHGPLLLNILRSAVGRRCIGTGAVWAGVQPWGAGVWQLVQDDGFYIGFLYDSRRDWGCGCEAVK